MPLDFVGAVMCGLGTQEAGEFELQLGPCQTVESPLYVETEAQGVQVSACSHAARQSQNRNPISQETPPTPQGAPPVATLTLT